MFKTLINYIEAQMNLEDFVISGRYRRVFYANSLASCEVEYFDNKPVSVKRGKEVIYNNDQVVTQNCGRQLPGVTKRMCS